MPIAPFFLGAEHGKRGRAEGHGKQQGTSVRTNGLVRNEQAQKLSGRNYRLLDSLGKRLNAAIEVTDTLVDENGVQSDGLYDAQTRTIKLALDGSRPLAFTAAHEITHLIQDVAPEQYRTYRDYAMKQREKSTGMSAEALIRAKIERYGQEGVRLTEEGAIDEIAADFTADMIEDAGLFEALVKHDASLAQRILTVIRKALQTLRGAFRDSAKVQGKTAYGVELDELEQAAKLWEQALNAAEQNAQGYKNTAGTEGGGVKYSIKRTSKMTLAEQLKRFYDGKMASSDAFYFGFTPETLNTAGFDNVPLVMTISDFKKSTRKKHNIPRRVLKNLLTLLGDPVLSFSEGDRAIFLLNDIDGDGKPLVVALQSGIEMDNSPANAIQSIYGLDHPAEWVDNQRKAGKQYTVYNKEKADEFLRSTAKYYGSQGEDVRSLDGTVTQDSDGVNTQKAIRAGDVERDMAALERDKSSE